MLFKSLQDMGLFRPVTGHFAQVRMPLRVGPDLAERAFVAPLGRALAEAGLGEVSGHEVRRDPDGEPDALILSLSLATDAPAALDRVAAILEGLDAPVGSTIGNAECPDLKTFGTCEGLGLYLPGPGTDEEARLAILEACTDALDGAGLYQGSCTFGGRTALYFYGDSFNRMRAALTFVLTHDPRCKDAYARRLT